ncbi:MAG: cysteine--tRNA ligase [Deltaproteobacteria bacterium]|nr:cysteine--tRNA ligase [Deltaproteobacteria bacterium]
MALRVWNTLTDQKEELKPIVPGEVGIYVCGITVYDLLHLGHARFLVAFDTAVRYLRFSGVKVKYVRNWTDVDDKIIRRAGERGIAPTVLAAQFIDEARKDMLELNVVPADVEPKATEHIAEMVDIIQRLIDKGHAYAVNGDVYFAVRSFPPYGRLSRRNLDDLLSGARVDTNEQKRDPLDFALWKATKPGEPESVSWPAPWGRGRPGWHIECSAMCQKHLGVTFDLHGGGKDLVFPHHENEIAQSEAASGKPLANAWLHNGFVTLDSEKLSKSLGNFKTVRDLLQNWDGEALRTFLLSTHYRSPINFTYEAVAEADRRVDVLYEAQGKALAYLAQKKFAGQGKALESALTAFREAMDDDFNTARAMADLLALYSQINAKVDGKAAPQEVADLLESAKVTGAGLGLGWRPATEAVLRRRTLAAARKGIDPQWVAERIEARLLARKEKRYPDADAIRAECAAKGVELRDGPAGTDWRVPA